MESRFLAISILLLVLSTFNVFAAYSITIGQSDKTEINDLRVFLNQTYTNTNNSDTLDYLDSSYFYPASNPYGFISSYSETDPVYSANIGNYYLKSNPFSYLNISSFPWGVITGNASIADNSSWNQSHANGLYYPISNPYGYLNYTINTSYYLVTNPFSYLNISSFPWAVITGNTTNAGNSSWNQSHANGLYYPLSNPYGYLNYTINGSYYLVTNPFSYLNISSFPWGVVTGNSSNVISLMNGNDSAWRFTGNSSYAQIGIITGNDSAWRFTGNSSYAQLDIITGNDSAWRFTGNDTYARLAIITGNESAWLGEPLWQGNSTLYLTISDIVAPWIINTAGNIDFNATKLRTEFATIGIVSGNNSLIDTRLNDNLTFIKGTSGNTNGAIINRYTNHTSNSNNIIFAVMSNGTTGNWMPHFWVQNGAGTQASGISRSFMIANENFLQQGTSNITSCSAFANYTGDPLKIDCNTTTTGADLLVGDDAQIMGDVWLKDDNSEYHFLSNDLTHIDDLMTETSLDATRGFITTTNSVTNYTFESTDGGILEVNFGGVLYNLGVSGINLTLTNGTNTTPTANYIHFKMVGSTPTLITTTTYPSYDHIDIANYVLGAPSVSSINVYAYSRNRYEVDNFVERVIERLEKQGVLYLEGFDTNANTSAINISTGELMQGIFEFITSNLAQSNQRFYFINSTGNFVEANSLTAFTQYNDGTTFAGGANERVNIVWGIVITNTSLGGTTEVGQRLVAVLPSNQGIGNYYASVATAIQDNYGTLNYFPPDDAVKRSFLPIARTVLRPSTDLFEPFVGTTYYRFIAGTTSTGGSAPTSSTTDHAQLTNLDYASAAHTGFASSDMLSGNITALGTNITNNNATITTALNAKSTHTLANANYSLFSTHTLANSNYTLFATHTLANANYSLFAGIGIITGNDSAWRFTGNSSYAQIGIITGNDSAWRFTGNSSYAQIGIITGNDSAWRFTGNDTYARLAIITGNESAWLGEPLWQSNNTLYAKLSGATFTGIVTFSNSAAQNSVIIDQNSASGVNALLVQHDGSAPSIYMADNAASIDIEAGQWNISSNGNISTKGNITLTNNATIVLSSPFPRYIWYYNESYWDCLNATGTIYNRGNSSIKCA